MNDFLTEIDGCGVSKYQDTYLLGQEIEHELGQIQDELEVLWLELLERREHSLVAGQVLQSEKMSALLGVTPYTEIGKVVAT